MSHASQTATTLTSLDPVLNLPLDPSLALVFHTCNRDLSLVTRHRITKTGKGHSLDAGRPLSREDEQQILRLLDRDTRPSGTAGWLPPNLLAEKGDAVMWFEPGSVRTLLIGGDDGVSTVSVHTPNLVLALNGKQTLHVYAVATSERPGPDTPVFHAPLGNIYADGTYILAITCRVSQNLTEHELHAHQVQITLAGSQNDALPSSPSAHWPCATRIVRCLH